MTDGYDTLDREPTRGADTVLAGRYRIVRELGRGGMGTVYLAADTKLDDRQVAVKMPPAVLARNPRAVQNLKQEALLAMQLSHPHIVTLRAFEEGVDGVFLVMDYVEGRTLEHILGEKGKMSEEEVLRLFRPVAEALDYAHSRKVVHRDVKPSNIIVGNDWTPYIMDFGVAREMKDTYTRVTGKGTSGTLPYMSPEQLRGAPPAPAQDVYSLAATMYECLAGHPPFWRGQIEYQIVNEEPVPPGGEGSPLSSVLMRGLSKKPEDRPSSCAEAMAMPAPDSAAVPERPAAEARERFAESEPRGVPRQDSGPRAHAAPRRAAMPSKPGRDETKRRHTGLWGVLVVVAVVALGCLIWYASEKPVPSRSGSEVSRRNPGRSPASRVSDDPPTPGPPSPPRALSASVRVPSGCRAKAGSGVVTHEGLRYAREVVHEATGMELVFIPAGSFLMGSLASEADRDDDERQHRVTISRPFYLGKYEVTQGQWQRVMGSNPSRFKSSDRLPVEVVSWEDCQAFCRKTGLRLPTEAEWEYACRAGSQTRYCFGDDKEVLKTYAWYRGNSGGRTHAVGGRKPNAWGLYDMHGNVWEWCGDWYGAYPSGSVTDPTGPGSGSNRVLRGGSWGGAPRFCRSAYRTWYYPGLRTINYGFRAAVDLE